MADKEEDKDLKRTLKALDEYAKNLAREEEELYKKNIDEKMGAYKKTGVPISAREKDLIERQAKDAVRRELYGGPDYYEEADEGSPEGKKSSYVSRLVFAGLIGFLALAYNQCSNGSDRSSRSSNDMEQVEQSLTVNFSDRSGQAPVEAGNDDAPIYSLAHATSRSITL